MTENIFDNEQVTANSKQLEILKEHFPNCFDKSGSFQLDKFKEIIEQEDLNISQEGYSLNWLGKSYARLLANENPRTLLKPDNEHNDKPENKESQNLLIKGDNIEVLKHLKYAYTGAIKMIYIDPPYNTGSDGFVYQDDRKFTPTELAELANVTIEEAKRILSFTEKGSNSHSAWLTFMYPRLYVARQLLKEDGVIFISIDDNEQAQLKLLCDEVFGEENFVGGLSILNNPKGRSQDKYIALCHEYLYCYSKSMLDKGAVSIKKTSAEIKKDYPLSDENGAFREIELRNTHREFGKHNRPNLFYPFYVDPHGNLSLINSLNSVAIYPIWDDGFEGCWTWGKDKADEETNLISARKVKGVWKIYRKSYSVQDNELVKKQVKSIWAENRFHTVKGQAIFNDLFQTKEKIFQSPKSIDLIKEAIEMSSAFEEDIILDFFAGSGTTAHATIELNTKDGGSRQYILVQLPEETEKNSEAYKAGYNTIFDITKARIEKVIDKIKTENPNYKGDLGFKIFETKPLPERYNDEIERLEKSTELFHAKDIAKDDLDSILTTWGLFDNIKLTDKFTSIDLNGYEGYFAKETLYLMYSEFGMTQTKALIRKMEDDSSFVVEKIVLFAHNFDSKQQRELEEAMVSFRNKKSVDINVIKRY